jgi:hypothetical protein
VFCGSCLQSQNILLRLWIGIPCSTMVVYLRTLLRKRWEL